MDFVFIHHLKKPTDHHMISKKNHNDFIRSDRRSDPTLYQELTLHDSGLKVYRLTTYDSGLKVDRFTTYDSGSGLSTYDLRLTIYDLRFRFEF